MSLTALLPDGVSALGAAGLVAASMFTSGLTASVGIGGGVLLLALMSFVIPVEALIAVHGVAQLGSNTGRAAVLVRSVAWPILLPFVVAAAVGAAVGALIVSDLPDRILLGVIGVFVLATTWLKPPPLGGGKTIAIAVGGFLATLLSMFVGATGPFVIALLRQACPDHVQLVATNAAAMTAQHGVKVAAFSAIGFAFVDYVPLLIAIIASGFVGTLIGTRFLKSLPEKTLKTALKWTLTIIGIELVIRTLFFS